MMKKEISIEKIRYSEHYAFYTIVKIDKLNSTFFKIKTLINSIDDYDKNRTFHLIINSFEYINNTNLILKEKEPTFINFDNTIDKINLLYNLTNKDIYIYPISVSFFIKEKIKFRIKVDNNEGKSFIKIVSYKDRILIDTKFIPKNDSIINIVVEKIDKNAKAVMIIKIIGDYLAPIFLQKNILNAEFIPTNASYQYFYMEVFKGEEGEIILNYKRYKGILISKLISKEEINEYYIYNSSDYYPKEEEEINNSKIFDYLEYNEYTQNISFNTFQTNNLCNNGCYLLLTYYSIYLNNKTSDITISGSEFTLLCRILDNKNEDRSQIITIPLNEYIFGTFEQTGFNTHYYSMFVPENTTNLILEMNFFNIKIYYYGIGVERFNIYKAHDLGTLYMNVLIDFDPIIYEVEPIGGNFISFALTNMVEKISNYYFRILPYDNINNKYLIYPVDSNTQSICKTTEIFGKNTCFFIIDNNYKYLQSDIIIYAYGGNKISYSAGFVENNESDYYSLDLEELNFKNNMNQNNNFFIIDNKE